MLCLPSERRRDLESFLEVVDGLLCIAPGMAYITEDTVTLANRNRITFTGEEVDRSQRGFGLFVLVQQPGEVLPTARSSRCVIVPLINL